MMQSPENSKAAFWSCPTTQIFSQLPTHTPQHNDLASPPLRRLHFSTTLSPFIIAFGAINPAHSPSVIKTDAAVCCRSQVSSPWDISHSPPAWGPFAAATLPSKGHKPATSGMQKQQHFPCKSPLAARQEGLEITPPWRACVRSTAGRFAACTSVPLTPAQLLAASRICSVLLAPGSPAGCLHPHGSCNAQELGQELQSWGCAPRGSVHPLAPISLRAAVPACCKK